MTDARPFGDPIPSSIVLIRFSDSGRKNPTACRREFDSPTTVGSFTCNVPSKINPLRTSNFSGSSNMLYSLLSSRRRSSDTLVVFSGTRSPRNASFPDHQWRRKWPSESTTAFRRRGRSTSSVSCFDPERFNSPRQTSSHNHATVRAVFK